jgi:hypothetical protein
MSGAEYTADWRTEAEQYLRKAEEEFTQAVVPRQLTDLLIGLNEFVPRLGQAPELQARFNDLLERVRAEHRPYDQMNLEQPPVASALAWPMLDTRDKLVALRPLPRSELRELVTRSHALRQRSFVTERLRRYLDLFEQEVRAQLEHQLGVPEVFIELIVATPVDTRDETQALRRDLVRLPDVLPQRFGPRAPQEYRYDENQLYFWVEGQLTQASEEDFGPAAIGMSVRSTSILLALRDYWDFYWFAQNVLREMLNKLFDFGQNPPPLTTSSDAVPPAVKRVLLTTLRRDPPITDLFDALEGFTYGLLQQELISYAQAVALVQEVTERTVSVAAWSKRLTRWADQHSLPRLDGRRFVRSEEKTASQPLSLAQLIRRMLR